MYSRIKTIVVSLLVLCGISSITVFGQTPNLPTVDMLGGQYYFYEVESDDSAYGIAKKFGWDYDELCRLNPQVIKNLKKGAVVYYPTGNPTAETTPISDVIGEAKVITHVVRKGDTVYSIAHKYNIPVETIYQYYPAAREGIKEGDTIVIDRTTAPTQQVVENKPAEIVADNDRKIGVVNIDAQEEHAKKLPQIASVADSVAVAPIESVAHADAQVNILDIITNQPFLSSQDVNLERQSKLTVLLDNPSLQRDREFMRGFILALQDMQESGQKVKLDALDAGKGESAILAALDSISPDVVILTHDKDIPAWITNYGNTHNLPIVNVFDVKYPGTNSNPSMVQILTPSKEFNHSIAQYIYNNLGPSKLIFIDTPAVSDGIAEELRNIWNPTEVLEVPAATLPEKALRENTAYTFYINSTKKDEVQDAIQKIANLKENAPLAKVVVIGRPALVTFANSISELLCNNDVYIPSRFYADWNSPQLQKFTSDYETLFKRKPTMSFPTFSLSGYDIAQAFIPSIAANQGDLSLGMLRGMPLQSDIILQKTDVNGGYLNTAVYMVHFTPFNTIEKIIAE